MVKSKDPNLFGHSIKNPHIIHWCCGQIDIHLAPRKHFVLKRRYACTNCFTPEKATGKLEKVTCKNCLKIMEKTKNKGRVLLVVDPWIAVEKIGVKEII